MLTDSELLQRLHDVLRTSDLDTATAATVRRRLEEELGVDLSDRKPYIRQQIDVYLQSHYADGNPKDDDVHESGNDEVVEQSGSVSNDHSEEEDEEQTEAPKKKKINSERNETTANAKKRGGGGFSKPCALSPQLQKITGEPEMARTEVVKKIWAYIKEKDLQNPKNKRKIICDEVLHEVFRVKSIDMFQMNKALSKHIWPIEEEYATVKPSEKKTPNKRGKRDEPEQNEKQKKAKVSGFTSPLPLSDALIEFFGTGENELSRADVVKRMWAYIKQNDLQDPSDKRRILCDDKLKELFKVDSFVGFTVAKLLTTHFIKKEE